MQTQSLFKHTGIGKSGRISFQGGSPSRSSTLNGAKLKDLYSAENQLVKTLPKLAKAES